MNNFAQLNELISDENFQEIHRIIKKKSIFDILGIEKRELSHTFLLTWLLNPQESHQMGFEPFRLLLFTIYKSFFEIENHEYNAISKHTLLSPIHLSMLDFNNIIVEAEKSTISEDEKSRVDIYISYHDTFKDRKYPLILIEYKIQAGLGKNQLEKYQNFVNKSELLKLDSTTINPILIYITPEIKNEKTDTNFINIDYNMIYNWLTKLEKLDYKCSKAKLLINEFKITIHNYTMNKVIELKSKIESNSNFDLNKLKKIIQEDLAFDGVKIEYNETLNELGLLDKLPPDQIVLDAKKSYEISLNKDYWEIKGNRELMIHNVSFRNFIHTIYNISNSNNPRLQIYHNSSNIRLNFYKNQQSICSSELVEKLANSLRKRILNSGKLDKYNEQLTNREGLTIITFSNELTSLSPDSILFNEIVILEKIIEEWLKSDLTKQILLD